MKWPKVKLDSIKADVRYAFVGGPFGSNLTTRDYVEEGVPVIRGNNLPADRLFLDDDFVFVTDEKADHLQANTAYPGDVIFTQRGTLGQVGIIPLEAKFSRYVISQSQMKLLVNPEKANARFVYYFFRLPSTVQSVINHALTSGVPHINLGILKDFELPLPPLTVQEHIADILATYDDLIENNRRRIALLEEAARQLYREWFVRLRFPGHEHTRITHGVPERWERKVLGDICPDVRETALPEALEPDTSYIGLEHMPRRSITLSEWGRAEDVTSTKHRFRTGEILFGKIRPYFHKVGITFVARRLAVLVDLPQLDVTDAVQHLAQALLTYVPLPPNAQVDALHIAVATVHGMDYLVTWNCTHIANATLRHRIEAICRAEGYEPPIICTPQELLEV